MDALRETAEQIDIGDSCCCKMRSPDSLCLPHQDIESALKAERERCAKIAERAYASENVNDYRIYDAGQRAAIHAIANAIRSGEWGGQTGSRINK